MEQKWLGLHMTTSYLYKAA